MNAKRRLAMLAGASLLTGFCGVAGAESTIRFVEPGRYVDAGVSEAERARNLRVLERHLRAAAAPCVAAGEHLRVDVLDVDLAGDIDWSRSATVELRVLREVSWPRIELDYVLVDAGGQPLVQRREQISDMNYLMHSGRARFARDTLPYERSMLEDWAGRRLCRPPR